MVRVAVIQFRASCNVALYLVRGNIVRFHCNNTELWNREEGGKESTTQWRECGRCRVLCGERTVDGAFCGSYCALL